MQLFHTKEELAVGGEGPAVLCGYRFHVVAGGAERAHDGEHVVVQEDGPLIRRVDLLGVDELVFQLTRQGIRRVRELDEAARRAELELSGAVRHRRHHGQSLAGEPAGEAAHGGQYLTPGHGKGGLALNGHELAVLLLPYLLPGAQLGVGKDLVPGVELHVRLVQHVGQGLGRGAQVVQPAPLRLLDPGGVVAVAVEDYALVFAHDALYESLQRGLEVLRGLELVGKLPELLGNGCVQSDVRGRDGCRGAGHAELELVACEGKGRGAVAVRRVLGEAGQRVDADLEELLLPYVAGSVVFNRFKYAGELFAKEHGDDGRRGLRGAEPVVVAGRSYRNAKEVLVVVRGFYHRAEEEQELGVLARGLARIEEVHAGVCGEGPVVVFAGAVHTLKGLFVEEADQTVLLGRFLHDVHDELVVVRRDVRRVVDAGELVLCWGGLVVLCLGRDADSP